MREVDDDNEGRDGDNGEPDRESYIENDEYSREDEILESEDDDIVENEEKDGPDYRPESDTSDADYQHSDTTNTTSDESWKEALPRELSGNEEWVNFFEQQVAKTLECTVSNCSVHEYNWFTPGYTVPHC